ncbi:hypothetical protein [Piscirickettsia salmonis]|nr:hypothetical protein [Piscirickettsia salmonis]
MGVNSLLGVALHMTEGELLLNERLNWCGRFWCHVHIDQVLIQR